ncbi:hypothetical protein LCGC14_1160790 [marine sediment metagenome]|uniref:Uncharacterized protein n=1 Tax=marine sediment metagenome TaxID=412755 RepID=A0A0F9PYB2_9ZZZZ
MIEKNTLITWIHRVEHQLENQKPWHGKRLYGIVTEFFFEKYLTGQAGVPWPRMLSFGWSYCYTNYNKTHRRWLKISEGNDYAKVAGHKLVRRILSICPSDEFFILQPELSLSGSPPTLIWNVQGITLTRDRLKLERTEAAVKLESQLDERIRVAL